MMNCTFQLSVEAGNVEERVSRTHFTSDPDMV